jgi:hypothetical protein
LVLSKRERLIAFTTLGAIGLLALDRFLVEPLLAANTDLSTQIDGSRQRLEDADKKLKLRRNRARIWAQMQNEGLRRKDIAEAESQMMNNIRDWAQESGMNLVSVKPERTETVSIKPDTDDPNEKEKKSFTKSTLRVNGTGGMAQISRFLWHVESAQMPTCIVDLQISTRKEATDDLSLQMGVSTVCLIPDTEKDAAEGGAAK